MVDYKIYSLNVRGIRDKVKRRIVFRHLKKKYPGGIYILQETHSSDDVEQSWKLDWNGPVYFNHGETDSCGVTTLIYPGLDLNVLDIVKDDCGRFLALRIQLSNEEEFYICNIYAPTRNKVQEQIKFLNYVKNSLCLLNPLNVILGGDFNTIFDVNMDKQGGSPEHCTNLYTKELIAFIETFDLIDAVRFLHPDKRIYTRIQRNPPVLTRIDHWLISSHLANYLKTAHTLPGIKSDHSIIYLQICSNSAQRGRGFWKFNSTLLRDITYVKTVSDMIDSLKTSTSNMVNKHLRWDYIKSQIRGFTLQYSSKKHKERKEYKLKLEKDLYEYQNQLHNDMSVANIDKYYFVKEELEKVEEMETKGAILRSKVRWSEGGEKNTKYFLNLEKKNAVDKHICQLQLPNGDIISDPKLILGEQKKFYQSLYSDHSEDEIPEINECFTDNLNTLSKEDAELCEGLITEQECAEALKEMVNGKSPGCDGFTVDFYKVFWKDIKILLVESLNYSFEKGELSVDQRRGIITLLPKKSKIRLLLKNWRPISLLNTDYKILTKSLALRLHKVLPSVINLDQTGFLKGRFIGENIRTIADLIDYTSLKNDPGIILLLDFEKAFDTVNWSFIIQSLHLFKFGPEFIHWIKTIYSNIESTVINYGNTTGFFKLHRGIRQGCPISPYLFILAVEVMANGIRRNKNIKGIIVGDTEFKISQLADDTTIFVSNFESVYNVLKLIELFSKISGLKLNVNKTVAKCIGSLEQDECGDLYNLKWTKGPVQTLGIIVSNDPQVIVNEVFMPRLKVFSNILNMWHARGLTLKGKVTILKSLALPQLQYPMSVLPIPETIVEMVDHMITDFMWSKRKPKIKKDVLIQNIENGGLKASSFAAMVEANRISWIKRLLSDSDMKWKSIFRDLIKPFAISHLTETHLDEYYISGIKIPFYKQLYSIWNTKRYKPEKTTDFMDQIIWNNRFIQLPIQPRSNKCRPLFWPELYQLGVIKVRDLFRPDYTFINLQELCTRNNVKCNFIQVIRLKKAIPQQWIADISSQLTQNLVSNEDMCINLMIKDKDRNVHICKASTKMIYESIIISKYVRPTALIKWSEQFEIDESDWSSIFQLPFKTTRETKLQTLQYKLIHRIIPCKKWLFNQKVISYPYCTSCSEECIENIQHLFIQCSKPKEFWKNLESWWNRSLEPKIQLTNKHILFGIYYDLHDFITVNYIIILAKWFIFTNAYLEREINMYRFLVLLKHHLDIEKQICYSNGKKEEFAKRWSHITDNL